MWLALRGGRVGGTKGKKKLGVGVWGPLHPGCPATIGGLGSGSSALPVGCLFSWFLFTCVVNVQGKGGEGGGQWPAGVSKASKSCSRLTGDTRRLCRRTVCVCVCGQTRRRPLGKISLLLYFGGSGKKPLSWVNRPPSPHTHTPPSLLNDQLLHQCKCKLSIPAVMSGAGSGVRLRGS